MNRPPPTVDACSGGVSMNWALNMPVTMSSTGSSSTAGSLVTDGNADERRLLRLINNWEGVGARSFAARSRDGKRDLT